MPTMLWERVVVTAREFLETKNINDCREFNEPLYRTKLLEFDWDAQFSAASTMVELIWKIAIGRETTSEMRRLDKLFSPSAVATHANFRGCRSYKTGNLPQKGSIAIWRRGNSWQGDMAIVTQVSEDKQNFDVIQGTVLMGSEGNFIQVVERRGKYTSMPFKTDKLNLVGFIYPPDREIA